VNEKHFSVVVIGAGPAGSAAAMTLASRGTDVCLIDKKVFPREKLCGGLLTRRSRLVFEEVFGEGWEDVVVDRAEGVRFFDKESYLSGVEHYSTLYFTRRIQFDHYLLQKATGEGVVPLLGNGVREIDPDERRVTLKNGQKISYDFLVGADGVQSIVAKKCYGESFDKKEIGFALECEVPLSNVIKAVEVPEIYFNSIEWGYAWVFPKRDTLTVGIGGLHRLNRELRKGFDSFLLQRFGEMERPEIKGHYIPFGGYRKRAAFGNVFLCGDAAGYVETVTGEGIAFAMQSGHNAARVILEKLKDPTVDTEALYRAYNREITLALGISRILRTFIFSKIFNRIFLAALGKSKTIGKRHLDLMAAKISYPQYLVIILKKILLSPWTMLKRSWRK